MKRYQLLSKIATQFPRTANVKNEKKLHKNAFIWRWTNIIKNRHENISITLNSNGYRWM